MIHITGSAAHDGARHRCLRRPFARLEEAGGRRAQSAVAADGRDRLEAAFEGVTFRYHVPSGYTTQIGPSVQMRRH